MFAKPPVGLFVAATLLISSAILPAEAQTETPAVRAGAPPLPGSPAVPSGQAPAEAPAPAAPASVPPPPPASSAAAPASLDAMATAYIRGLQRALPAHGYRPGPETGQLDPATASAITAYQRDAGLPEDPRSDTALKATLDSVSFARPPIMAGRAAGAVQVPSRVAIPASTIGWIQQQLDRAGYDAGRPDAVMGARTDAAIRRFQAANGLPPDGRIDNRLIDLLRRY